MLAHHTWLQPAPRLACGVFDYDCTSDPPQFSWRAVAASAITAGVTQGVGEAMGGANWQNSASLDGWSKFAIDAGSRFIGGTVAQAVTNKGGRVNFGQVAADAFGNALGNSIARGITSGASQQGAKAPQTQGLTLGSGRSELDGWMAAANRVGFGNIGRGASVGTEAGSVDLTGQTYYPQPGSPDFMGPPAPVNLGQQANSLGNAFWDHEQPPSTLGDGLTNVDFRRNGNNAAQKLGPITPRGVLLDEIDQTGSKEALYGLATSNANKAKLLADVALDQFQKGNKDYGQMLLDQAKVHIEAADYARQNAGGITEYSSVPRSTGLVLTPGFSPFDKNFNTGAYSAGLSSNLYSESRTQAQIDASLDRTTGLLVTAPLWIAGAGLSYSSVGLGLGLRSLYSTIGWQGTAALGFGTSATMDAGMQYIDTESWDKNGWRPGQTLFAGTVGAFTGPLGATSGLKTNILLGGLGAAANTQFQNYTYGDDKSYGLPMVAGAMFGAFGYRGGAATTRGLSYYQPERYFANLNPQVPALFQPIAVNKMPQFFGVTAGGVISGTSPVGENLYKEFFVPKPGKP